MTKSESDPIMISSGPKPRPQEDPALVARAAGKGRSVVRLDATTPRTAPYILTKLKQAVQETRLTCDFSDRTKNEAIQVFQHLVDLVKHDLWVSTALLVVDYERMSITFTNNSIVLFEA